MIGMIKNRDGGLRLDLNRSMTALLAAFLVIPAMLIGLALAVRIAAQVAALARTLPSPAARSMVQRPAPAPRVARYQPADRSVVDLARSPHSARAAQARPGRVRPAACCGGIARPGSGSARRTSR